MSFLTGCAQADSETTGSAASGKGETSAESVANGGASASENGAGPVSPTEPPTVYEVSQLLDIRTLPRLEVVQLYDQQVGSMNYVAKSDMATAFYEKLYQDL